MKRNEKIKKLETLVSFPELFPYRTWKKEKIGSNARRG